MRINRTIVTAALATAVLVAPACSDDDSTTTTEAGGDTSVVETTTTAAPDELTVEDPWIRAMPAASGMTAGYLTITSPIDDELLEVRVDPSVAAVVELHETVAADMEDSEDPDGEDSDGEEAERSHDTGMDDGDPGMDEGSPGMDEPDGHGAMTMRQVESIPVPAGTPVVLEPGGLHIMFLEVPAQLEVGQQIELTLVFAEAGEVTTTAEVRAG